MQPVIHFHSEVWGQRPNKTNTVMGSAKFDKGLQWAECNDSQVDVESYGSSYSIANSNNVYNSLSFTQLGED